MDDRKEFVDVVVRQTVEHLRPDLADADEIGVFEDRKLMGDQGLARPHLLDDLTDVLLFVFDRVKDLEAREIARDVEHALHLV